MTRTSFVEGLRRLGLAATESAAAVRAELDRAIRSAAPAVDVVLFFEEENEALRCVAGSGSRGLCFRGVRLARDDLETLPALALAQGRRASVDDGVRGFHPADAFAIAIPLAVTAGPRCVVYVAACGTVDDACREDIVLLADHASFAYSLAWERTANAERAEIDALTGLLTPRALRERLATTLERARFAPLARIALLFVDTDHFKRWNDTYGHASGDTLLRALARILRGVATADDLVARNGGDEFCLVFADCEKSRAVERAEALRAAIAAIDTRALRPADATADVVITASIGVAAYPADARSPHALLERADEAMYHCKRSGRNGVAFLSEDGRPLRH